MIAFITITLNNGTRYSANHVSIQRRGWQLPAPDGRVGFEPMAQVVVFECSGSLHAFPADEVRAIDYGINAHVDLPSVV